MGLMGKISFFDEREVHSFKTGKASLGHVLCGAMRLRKLQPC